MRLPMTASTPPVRRPTEPIGTSRPRRAGSSCPSSSVSRARSRSRSRCAGCRTALACIARRELPCAASAPAVGRLLDAGAIILGVTNISELTLWIESDNHLYGRTSNPYDPARTAGGSSGGEGAAVGSGGSPFGLGSDIAGSIRIPRSVLRRFRATSRVPGSSPTPACGRPRQGESGRMLAVGPLTRRREDLMPLLELIAGPGRRGPSPGG